MGFGYLISKRTYLLTSDTFRLALNSAEKAIIILDMVLDTVNLILAITISVGTIVTTSAMGVRWLVKHYLTELKPNSGSSMKDQLNNLEARMDKSDTLRKETYLKVQKLENKIDDLYDKFIDYLSNNNK